ncbi:MAG: LysE family transporter [Bacteroidota bacterium]
MRKYLEVFLWGLVISALGTLPLGTLNVAAMQMAITEGLLQGIYFSLGVALMEVIYVRVSLVGVHWLRQHANYLRWMDWIAFIIVLTLAAGSFYAALYPSESKSFVLITKISAFILGLLMSALNPLQIPFWLAWSSYLFSKNLLHHKSASYNWYTIGIGIGTLTSLAIFVYSGRLLVDRLNAHENIVNYVIGIIFLVTAIIQLIKIIKQKGLAESTEKKAAELEIAEQSTG